MCADQAHIRHCMLFQFDSQENEKNAAKAARSIRALYGDDALGDNTCWRWFTRFSSGDRDLNDKERTGRPVEADDDLLEELLEEDPRRSTRELALMLSVSQPTVCNRLHALGKVQKVGKWIPHELSEVNISQRLSICASLASRQKKKSFLWQIVTGDEKWLYYDNPVWKKQWVSPDQAPIATPKRELHGKKVMLCVWWDQKGIIYWELLEPRQTVTADLYSKQLMRLSEVLQRKRPYGGKESARWFSSWQRKATCCEKHPGHDRELRLGSLAPPGVFTRLGTYRLPFVPIDAVSPYRREVHFMCRYQKLAW